MSLVALHAAVCDVVHVEQAAQGDRPDADHVEPATHAPEEQIVLAVVLQADSRVCEPVQDAQAAQGETPTRLQVEPATHATAEQTVLAVALQAESSVWLPVHKLHAAHGELPYALQFVPGTQAPVGMGAGTTPRKARLAFGTTATAPLLPQQQLVVKDWLVQQLAFVPFQT